MHVSPLCVSGQFSSQPYLNHITTYPPSLSTTISTILDISIQKKEIGNTLARSILLFFAENTSVHAHVLLSYKNVCPSHFYKDNK